MKAEEVAFKLSIERLADDDDLAGRAAFTREGKRPKKSLLKNIENEMVPGDRPVKKSLDSTTCTQEGLIPGNVSVEP